MNGCTSDGIAAYPILQAGARSRRARRTDQQPVWGAAVRLGGYSARTRVAGNEISTSVPASTALLMVKVARLASASTLVSGRPSPVPDAERPDVVTCRNG